MFRAWKKSYVKSEQKLMHALTAENKTKLVKTKLSSLSSKLN